MRTARTLMFSQETAIDSHLFPLNGHPTKSTTLRDGRRSKRVVENGQISTFRSKVTLI